MRRYGCGVARNPDLLNYTLETVPVNRQFLAGTNMNTNRCPRCDQGHLRTWDDLTPDEREVIRRLPGDYTIEERQRHLWCTRCWYEATPDSLHNATLT